MTNLGEKMSDDEVDELLKAVDTSSGEINYTGIFDLGILRWHLADVRHPRPRSDYPRQLRLLSRPLLSHFLPLTTDILQALFPSVHESRPRRPGTDMSVLCFRAVKIDRKHRTSITHFLCT